MIEIRNKWLTMCNSVLSFILALFGVTSCSKESPDEYGSMVVEYGSPYAIYEATGTVIDESDKGVQGEEVIIRKVYPEFIDGSGRRYIESDTVKTDEKGTYTRRIHKEPSDLVTMRVVAHDPTGTYEDDSVDVVNPQKIAEGEGAWNTGVYRFTHDFKLKKKK